MLEIFLGVLQCVKLVSVSQYTNCIMTEAARLVGPLYHNTIGCIVTYEGLASGFLSCNTPRCIVTKKGAKAGTVLRHGREAKPQHGSPCAATLRWTPTTRGLCASTRLAGAYDTASWGLRHDAGSAHDTAAHVRLGAPVRTWVGWLGQQVVHLVHPACFWTQHCF